MKLTDAAFAVVVVAVLIFGVEHVVDARRDHTVDRLEGRIERDATVRAAAVAQTDTAIAGVHAAARDVARSDSGWRRATAAADRVPQILTSTVHDTVKIQELVTVIDTLRLEGDSLRRAAIADTVAAAHLRVQLDVERAAWRTERSDMAAGLAASEARHRHWGLGATIGYGAVREGSGVVRAGPAVVVGVTYRW